MPLEMWNPALANSPISEIITKCTRNDPNERYQTAMELYEDLRLASIGAYQVKGKRKGGLFTSNLGKGGFQRQDLHGSTGMITGGLSDILHLGKSGQSAPLTPEPAAPPTQRTSQPQQVNAPGGWQTAAPQIPVENQKYHQQEDSMLSKLVIIGLAVAVIFVVLTVVLALLKQTSAAVVFYSEDAAGNKNTNEANISSTVQENANGEYTGKMEFVLDTMPPVITTTGIESNKVYNAEFQRMEILISDTTPTGIQVFLNGTEVALSDAALADTAAWLVLDELTGVYTLNVPEQNELFGSQYVSVIAKDAAGNAAEALVEDFNVSTSLLVRLVHNGWIIVGGGLGIAALIFLLIQWKKKKV